MRKWPGLAHLMFRLGMKTKAHEAQQLWDLFRTRDDDEMGAADATPAATGWYRWRVQRTLDLRGRSRFVAKYPRHSVRLAWLDAVFPGCLFLHVARDWRAVVHSTSTWKAKRETGDDPEAYFGVRIPGWRERADVPHADFAGRIFLHVTRRLESDRERYGARFRVLRYEDFCERPLDEMRGVASWAGLRMTPEFERIAGRELEARNDKWKTGLDPAAIERIRATDPVFFARHEV